MAYNNGYPVTYPQMYYAPQYQPQQPQQAQSNGIIWVQGEAGAKSYLVAPNTTVQLWDSETQRIFLKSADASGMPSMKVLEYTIRDQTPANAPVTAPAPQTTNPSDFVTHAEMEAIAEQIEALKAQMNGIVKKGAALNE